jgi:hypothetical protein
MHAADEVAPWIERLARVGFVAKGILYGTIGALAVAAALHSGGKTGTDSRGAMTWLYSTPLGRPLLGLLAVGLAGYAVWRLVEGIHDPERRGTSAKAIAIRAGYIVRAGIHFALAGTAASLALWHEGGGERSGAKAKHWSARAMELPGGIYVLWAVALVLIGYGAYQLYRAIAAKLDNQLHLDGVAARASAFVRGVSRFGIAARGVVFGTIGVLLARAARHHDPGESGGIGDSMRSLVQLGRGPFLAIAAGVVAYGIYQFICAKYRRIAVR